MPDVPGPGAQGDHCTAGLTGYPAQDIVGIPGAGVYSPEAGVIRNVHVIPWSAGFGGLTMYLHGVSGADYFITHLDPDAPHASEGPIGAGDLLGHLPPVWAVKYIYVIHVHVGSTGYVYPSCNARGCSGEPGCGSGKSPMELQGASSSSSSPPPGSSPPAGPVRPGGSSQEVGVFSTITGGVGDIFGHVFGGLWEAGKDAAQAVASIAQSIVFLVHFVTNPDNWLRLVEFLLGIGLIAVGLAVYLRVFTGSSSIPSPAKLPPIPVE